FRSNPVTPMDPVCVAHLIPHVETGGACKTISTEAHCDSGIQKHFQRHPAYACFLITPWAVHYGYLSFFYEYNILVPHLDRMYSQKTGAEKADFVQVFKRGRACRGPVKIPSGKLIQLFKTALSSMQQPHLIYRFRNMHGERDSLFL